MTNSLKGKKILFFHDYFTSSGGSERVSLEVAKYLQENGAETSIVTYDFHPDALFNNQYNVKVHRIGRKTPYHDSHFKGLVLFPLQILALRRHLRKAKPDVIITRNSFECIYLYFATMFTRLPYVSFVFETPIWAYGDLRQHALVYRKTFNKLRELSPTYRYFDHLMPPKPNPLKRLFVELGSLAETLAVRKAKKVFAYSGIMKSEIKDVFKKDAVVLRGSISEEILAYQPKQNIKEKLGISGKKMILSVCRLAPRKRVDLLVRAMSLLAERLIDVVLVIGGRGPEEESLKQLARTLRIEDRVKFVGFIPEEELLDYYAACDVFSHADWAEADMTPIIALALKKKAVWTTDMETTPELKDSGYVFVAPPEPELFARAMEQALATEVNTTIDLTGYTWQKNNKALAEAIRPFLS